VASTVFSFTQSGIVVTQSGVAAADTSMSFRLFAETGEVSTGLAVANAGGAEGTLQFMLQSFDDAAIAVSDPVSIAAMGRLSLFIHEIPGFTDIPANFRGVLTLASTVPVSAVGVRGRYNERREFMIATTPAIPLEADMNVTMSIFPQIVTGSGYSTEFLLLSNGAGQGTVHHISQSGQSMPLPILR
jgi:hypothetical protein